MDDQLKQLLFKTVTDPPTFHESNRKEPEALRGRSHCPASLAGGKKNEETDFKLVTQPAIY